MKTKVAITAGLIIACTTMLHAQSIWFNEKVTGTSDVATAAFYGDLWGDDIRVAYFTSPSNNIYSMHWDEDEDQFSYDRVQATPEEIQEEFTDGNYMFTIITTNGSSGTVPVTLEGPHPPIPELLFPSHNSTNISLTPTIFWESWATPTNPSRIELAIWTELASGEWDEAVITDLTYTASSCSIPASTLVENSLYNMELYFVAEKETGGYKASIKHIQFSTGPSDTGALNIETAIELNWKSIRGMEYQVQYANNLISNDWTNLGDTTIGNGSTNLIFDSASSPEKFYRVIQVDL